MEFILNKEPIKGISFRTNIYKLLGINLATKNQLYKEIENKFEVDSLKYKYLMFKFFPYFKDKLKNLLANFSNNLDYEEQVYSELFSIILLNKKIDSVENLISDYLSFNLDIIDLIILEDLQKSFISQSINISNENKSNYLPNLTSYLNKFIYANLEEIQDIKTNVKFSRMGPYTDFYRSDEVNTYIITIDDIFLRELGDLSIPEVYSSPAHLISRLEEISSTLKYYDSIFEDIIKNINISLGDSGLSIILDLHDKIKHLIKHVLEMDEVTIIKNKSSVVINAKQSVEEMDVDKQEIFDIAIICVLRESELKQINNVFKSEEYKIEKDNTKYFKGLISTKTGKEKNIIISSSNDEMGMVAATSLSIKLISTFKPKHLVMVGISAGLKDRTKVGDIIIPEFAWDYGIGKFELIEGKREFKPYPKQIWLETTLERELKNITGSNNKLYLREIEEEWEKSHPRREEKLNIYMGAFASGSSVIADETYVKEIEKQHGKLWGFDMESYGVLYAAKYYSEGNTKGLIIKSVSDNGDSNKGINKNDNQNYAAFTSAKYLHHLIYNEHI